MKTLFIFNPHSGHNRRRPWFAGQIQDFISSQRLDAQLAITVGPGHATELARAAIVRGCRVVVAVGGDGTMNEVAQAVVNTPAALALVPCGSGNGLARHLGLPRAPLAALQLASGTRGRVTSVDTGTVNGRPFFNAMGLGLDAEVSRRFNRLERRGLPAYARQAWQALRAFKSESCAITANGKTHTLEVLLVAIANSDQYGNDARIAPGARVDDGLLDLVAVRAAGWVNVAMLVPLLFAGRIDRSRHVKRLAGPRFTIQRTTAGVIHTDGETHVMPALLEVAVQPRSLRLVVPAARLGAVDASVERNEWVLGVLR